MNYVKYHSTQYVWKTLERDVILKKMLGVIICQVLMTSKKLRRTRLVFKGLYQTAKNNLLIFLFQVCEDKVTHSSNNICTTKQDGILLFAS